MPVAVLDYEMFCKIRDLLDRQHLSQAQTARELGLRPHTVWKWSRIEQFRPRALTPRASRLDPYKGLIVRWLDTHPYSAQQIFQRLREEGFAGGVTIVKDYVHKIRPRKREAFLKLVFAPASVPRREVGCECKQLSALGFSDELGGCGGCLLVGFLSCRQGAQLLIPIGFERIGDETVIGIDLEISPLGQVGVVAS